MAEKRRWSKLSIVSFLCLLFPFFSYVFNFLLKNALLNIIFYFSFLFYLTSLILAIISLVQIKKYNLRGKWLAILTIIIWGLLVVIAIIVLGFFVYVLTNCGTEYYYQVPLKINVEGTNYQIKQIDNPSQEPNIMLINFNLSLDSALNKCAPDSFKFYLDYSKIIFADPKGEDYSKGFFEEPKPELLTGIYPNSNFKNYILHLKEGLFRQTKNLLKLNKEEFYLKYSIDPFYSQKTPLAGNVGTKGLEDYGCHIIYKRGMNDTSGTLKVIGTEGKLNFSPTRILCLKPYKNVDGKIDISDENCTFYELTSNLKLDYNIDLSKGEEEVSHHSCF